MKKFKKLICLFLVLFTLLTSNLGCNNFTNKDFIRFETWFFTSGVQNNLIIFELEEDNASFECIADDNCLYALNVFGAQKVTVSNNQRISWQNNVTNKKEKYFIDVIVFIEKEIRGFALIEIVYKEETDWYEAKVKTSKISNSSASRSYVENILEEIKR